MPILGSFGTANERAYGFGDSSFLSPTSLPSIITTNAALLYDASNVDSYSGSGTTWYDISGNGRNGTFNTAPTVNGTGGNKSINFPNTGATTLTIPSVYTVDAANATFTYVMVLQVGGDLLSGLIDGRGWQSRYHFGVFHLGFDSEGFGGFGSTSSIGNPPSSSVYGNYAMLYSQVSLGAGSTLTNTWVNDADVHIQAAMSHSFNNGTSEAVIGKATTTADIKMIALYPQSTAPTQLQAYNALKTRFGL